MWKNAAIEQPDSVRLVTVWYKYDGIWLAGAGYYCQGNWNISGRYPGGWSVNEVSHWKELDTPWSDKERLAIKVVNDSSMTAFNLIVVVLAIITVLLTNAGGPALGLAILASVAAIWRNHCANKAYKAMKRLGEIK